MLKIIIGYTIKYILFFVVNIKNNLPLAYWPSSSCESFCTFY